MKVGVLLTLLPENSNKAVEQRYKYLRGIGLQILGEDKLIPHVQNFLYHSPEKGKALLDVAFGYVNYPGIEEWTKETAFSNPAFFSMVVSIRLALKLQKNNGETNQAESLSLDAYSRMSDERIVERIRWYLQYEDTARIARDILNIFDDLLGINL